ncbi:MAG: response regulator [Acidobacteriota bacterium]|nr:MAG: response regulator [Acidobacteriota bacterium]
MQKLRVFIADDERPAREFLKALLLELGGCDVIGEADNGADAVELIKTLKPDLAILDLKMPAMSGLEAVRQLRKTQMPLFAFATAYDEYAVQAFELNAVDYLLKPVEKRRLAETLKRAADRLETDDWRSAEAEKLKNAARDYSDAAANKPLSRIPVKVRDEIILVPANDIACIEADGELLHITTTENRKFIINYRLKDIEARLDADTFIRLSRGALVNVNTIDAISPLPGGTYAVSLANGREIASSRLQSRILRERLLKL